MSRYLISTIIMSCMLLTGCPVTSQGSIENFFIGKDRQSPVLFSFEASNEITVTARFDESVHACSAYAGDEKLKAVPSGREVHITLLQKLLPSEQLNIALRVEDRAGNTTSIEKDISGKNSRIPRLLLNEFSIRGTKSQPDRIELRVLSDGDLAGITVYDGMYLNHSGLFTFPPYEVKQGEYVVLQYGMKENLHAHEHFFFAGEEGLGGSNGVISLYENCGHAIIDALPYSDRSDDSDTEYGGFGTAEVYEQIMELEGTSIWNPAVIHPETAVRTDSTTSTRSLNRRESGPAETASDQWYTVPTGSSSFGQPNCTETYSP